MQRKGDGKSMNNGKTGARIDDIHKTHLLLHGALRRVPQHLPQRKVQDVRHGVVGRDAFPAVVVHAALDGVADAEAAAGHHPHVHHVPAKLLHVGDVQHRGRRHVVVNVVVVVASTAGTRTRTRARTAAVDRQPAQQFAGVENLATGFCVKRRLVQHDADDAEGVVGGGVSVQKRAALRENRLDGRRRGVVPRVLGHVVGGVDAHVAQRRRFFGFHDHFGAAGPGARGGAAAFTLGFHEGVVRGGVHGEAGFFSHEGGEVQWEPHGVVQAERRRGRELRVAALLHLRLDFVKVLQAPGQGPVEGLLLFLNGFLHELHLGVQRRERVAQQRHHNVHQLVQEAFALRRAQHLLSVPHRAAQNPPKDVPGGACTQCVCVCVCV